MLYQIVTLRVPFGDGHQPPSTWPWGEILEMDGQHSEPYKLPNVTVLDCDPVSEDPDVMPLEKLPEPAAGDRCPHADCDLHLLWDPQERMLYCAADWEHG